MDGRTRSLLWLVAVASTAAFCCASDGLQQPDNARLQRQRHGGDTARTRPDRGLPWPSADAIGDASATAARAVPELQRSSRQLRRQGTSGGAPSCGGDTCRWRQYDAGAAAGAPMQYDWVTTAAVRRRFVSQLGDGARLLAAMDRLRQGQNLTIVFLGGRWVEPTCVRADGPSSPF